MSDNQCDFAAECERNSLYSTNKFCYIRNKPKKSQEIQENCIERIEFRYDWHNRSWNCIKLHKKFSNLYFFHPNVTGNAEIPEFYYNIAVGILVVNGNALMNSA